MKLNDSTAFNTQSFYVIETTAPGFREMQEQQGTSQDTESGHCPGTDILAHTALYLLVPVHCWQVLAYHVMAS